MNISLYERAQETLSSAVRYLQHGTHGEKVAHIAHKVENLLLELLDIAFAPRQLLKQVALIACLQACVLGSKALYMSYRWSLKFISNKEKLRRQLEDKMSLSLSYSEWQSYAEQLDQIDGFGKWRDDVSSPLFDSRVLQRRTEELRTMILNKDAFHLIFRLRSGLARDHYGIQHEGLYSRARAGTKKVIEKYLQSVCDALDYVCDYEPEADSNVDRVPTDAKLAFFNETRHSFGRTALLLSGGAALGFYHIGLARCLFLQNLLPRVISGSSAGSLMAAMLGTRTEDEMLEMINTASFRKDFFRSGLQKKGSVTSEIQYYLPQSFRAFGEHAMAMIMDRKSLLQMDTEHLKQVVRENVGAFTFQEAFDRTGRIINIIVAPINKYDPPRLLNYLTTPHVCVWSAVVASCAIPGVFESIALVVKEPDGKYRTELETEYFGSMDASDASLGNSKLDNVQHLERYSDGSVEKDLPMQQLSELFNVNHFIVSQVNPHSFLLSSFALSANVWSNAIVGTAIGSLRFLKAQCRDWLRNVIDLIVYRSVAPEWASKRGFTQILTQEYEGKGSDVNIMPWRGHLSVLQAFFVLMKNPSEQEYHKIVSVSERNTYPHISRIRAHCVVEMKLDQCVQRLRRRVASENIGHGMSNLDRSPSFYTSRSIVNLSGLSVTDPPPLASPLANDDNVSVKASERKGITKTTSMSNFYYNQQQGLRPSDSASSF